MPRLKALRAREILDSRGVPTVEAEALLDSGHRGRAMVPSGASTGEHEALELRDADPKRFFGKGVLAAVRNVVEVLGPELAGREASDQSAIDEAMIRLDGTANKGRLGANALLGASMAISRAAARAAGVPLYEHLRRAYGVSDREYVLPAPMLNVLNGGRHADSGLDIQEFMIVPLGASSFAEAIRFGAQAYQTLKRLLQKRKLSTAVGDEGGFAPRLKSHEEALALLDETLRSSKELRTTSRLALDAAASEFYGQRRYRVQGRRLSGLELAGRYEDWCARYPIVSIEDPFEQDDWAAWKAFTARCGGAIRVVGDDLFVTNVGRLERGIREGAANAILIKLNQIGTVTETVRAVLRARKAGFSSIISHRSGETEDSYIADLAVALNAGAIKTGAPCRSERLAKYNQLLRIEEELGPRAVYAGDRAFRLEGSRPPQQAKAAGFAARRGKTGAALHARRGR